MSMIRSATAWSFFNPASHDPHSSLNFTLRSHQLAVILGSRSRVESFPGDATTASFIDRDRFGPPQPQK